MNIYIAMEKAEYLQGHHQGGCIQRNINTKNSVGDVHV